MVKLLSAVGVAAVLGWTLLGGAAWILTKEQVHVTIAEGAAERRLADDPVAALADRLSAVQDDVRALARGMGESLGRLHDAIECSADERNAEIASQLAGLRRTLDALDRRLSEQQTLADETPVIASAARVEEVEEVEAPEVVPTEPPDVAPAPRKSFLAFTLPSDEFTFEGRRTWRIVPSLSRVGFDAKSTLHDFSGVTSKVEGSVEVDLAKPGEDAIASLDVDAESLDTGLADRDVAMREHLATGEHPRIRFELESLTARSVDADRRSATCDASGRMTIRGVTKSITMPVTLAIDDARRLTIEGETSLAMSDYGVEVPSKLGVISVQDEVAVWVALRARAVSKEETR